MRIINYMLFPGFAREMKLRKLRSIEIIAELFSKCKKSKPTGFAKTEFLEP